MGVGVYQYNKKVFIENIKLEIYLRQCTSGLIYVSTGVNFGFDVEVG